MQDLLPSGYTFVSKAVYHGTYDEATGVWTVGTFGAGNTATLDITATAQATGSYNNTATKTASTPTDPNAANNTATVTVTPTGGRRADGQDGAAIATPTIGQNVTFTDPGGQRRDRGDASGIVVQDLLPSGYTFVSKAVYNGTYDEATGVWTVGTITNGSTATLDVRGDGHWQREATTTRPRERLRRLPIRNAANDTATVTATPFSAADVRMTKMVQQRRRRRSGRT